MSSLPLSLPLLSSLTYQRLRLRVGEACRRGQERRDEQQKWDEPRRRWPATHSDGGRESEMKKKGKIKKMKKVAPLFACPLEESKKGERADRVSASSFVLFLLFFLRSRSRPWYDNNVLCALGIGACVLVRSRGQGEKE